MYSIRIIAIAVVVGFALAIGGGYVSHRRQGALEVAQSALASALKQDAQQKDILAALAARGSAAEARADSEAARADSLAKAGQIAVIRYVEKKAVAPAVCDSVVATADQAISTAQSEAEGANRATQAALEAANAYKAGRDTALASLARLSAAATAVHSAASPGFFERVRPKLLVAAVAGVNPITGRPDAVIGVGLGWSF